MKRKASWMLATAGVMAAMCLANAGAAIITFEGLLSEPETAWKPTAPNQVFQTGGATFSNLYDDTYGPYWEGFAYSNKTDITTPGHTNDLSAYVPGGGGSNTYAVAFSGMTVPTITYDHMVDMAGQGASITNTTYGYLSMMDGVSLPAKQFGGESGNDPDWFKLTITGYLSGNAGESIDFYLADFRFADNGQDYVIGDWTYVDFTDLGLVDELRFTLSSSDNGQYGMNTPAYFAIDNLIGAVPEPSSLAFAFASLGVLVRRKRQA
jgi:hypothetical protein